MGGVKVEVGTRMKYLGLTLDSHWAFDTHFKCLAPSVEATVNALGRLLPRLGGPHVRMRQLFAGVVRSKLLYGAPIWSADLMANRRSLQLVRSLHRTVAIRIVRGYRTISTVAAEVLAGLPPFELQATRCREMFSHIRRLSAGIGPADAEVRAQARRTLLDTWRAGAKGPRACPAKLGYSVGREWAPTDIQGDAGEEGRRPRGATIVTRWSIARHGPLRATLSPPSWDGTSRHRQCSKNCCRARAVGERLPLSANK
jgi:hypothetical protein